MAKQRRNGYNYYRMRKILSYIIFLLIVVTANVCWAGTTEDLDRSFRDLERSLRQNTLKDYKLKSDYSLQPPKSGATLDGANLQREHGADRAIESTQERFEKYMAQRNKPKESALEQLGLAIPAEYRLLVEIFVVAIFIIAASLFFYRQKQKDLTRPKDKTPFRPPAYRS